MKDLLKYALTMFVICEKQNRSSLVCHTLHLQLYLATFVLFISHAPTMSLNWKQISCLYVIYTDVSLRQPKLMLANAVKLLDLRSLLTLPIGASGSGGGKTSPGSLLDLTLNKDILSSLSTSTERPIVPFNIPLVNRFVSGIGSLLCSHRSFSMSIVASSWHSSSMNSWSAKAPPPLQQQHQHSSMQKYRLKRKDTLVLHMATRNTRGPKK